MDGLEQRIRTLVDATPGVRLSVVARRVGTPTAWAIDPDSVFHAASTMKLAVLVEVARRLDARALRLDERLLVVNAFDCMLGGGSYRLDPADDSETGLYGREGEHVAIGQLVQLMITLSSNLATNLLLDLLGVPAVQAAMDGAGAPSVHVIRGLEDAAAHATGLDNTVTANGLAVLLEQLALGRLGSPATCRWMTETLLQQQHREGIPAGLPAGTPVAHKTGSIPGLYHDAAIVDPAGPAPYVLVVLTQGLEEVVAGPALVASVAHEVHRTLGAAGS